MRGAEENKLLAKAVSMEVNSDNASGTRGGGAHCEAQNPKPNPNSKPNPSPSQTKAKSCKGSLYYSAVRKSKSKNPICFGISRTLNKYQIRVPSHTMGEAEFKASKRGLSLLNFKYACHGYSIYFDSKNSSADSQNKTPQLPFCLGLEMLLGIGKKPSMSPVDNVPAPAHKSEEHDHAAPQPRSYKPPHVTGEEYFNRFKRNASLVASGVTKNLNRVGNYIKETLDDILDPYRRGPK